MATSDTVPPSPRACLLLMLTHSFPIVGVLLSQGQAGPPVLLSKGFGGWWRGTFAESQRSRVHVRLFTEGRFPALCSESAAAALGLGPASRDNRRTLQKQPLSCTAPRSTSPSQRSPEPRRGREPCRGGLETLRKGCLALTLFAKLGSQLHFLPSPEKEA